jgi:hypothetical protein
MDEFEKLKKLSPKERLERLKKLEEKIKKEKKETTSQVEEEFKRQQEIPIPQIKVDSLSQLTSQAEKEIVKNKRFIEELSKNKNYDQEFEDLENIEQSKKKFQFEEEQLKNFYQTLAKEPIEYIYNAVNEIVTDFYTGATSFQAPQELNQIQAILMQKENDIDAGKYTTDELRQKQLRSSLQVIDDLLEKYKL